MFFYLIDRIENIGACPGKTGKKYTSVFYHLTDPNDRGL